MIVPDWDRNFLMYALSLLRVPLIPFPFLCTPFLGVLSCPTASTLVLCWRAALGLPEPALPPWIEGRGSPGTPTLGGSSWPMTDGCRALNILAPSLPIGTTEAWAWLWPDHPPPRWEWVTFSKMVRPCSIPFYSLVHAPTLPLIFPRITS